MEITIKNFANDGDQKWIGFMVNNEGKRFAIDKRVPLVDGKTDEQYVQDALALAQAEIDEWASSSSVVGRKWNPETNSFE
ncbi:MAG TPA: hypothetical protein VLA24_16195 [Pseudomonadales bacterium]|nr:hypothetical protein [Pseudomonadales bacterium]